jgi:hypothetical protein
MLMFDVASKTAGYGVKDVSGFAKRVMKIMLDGTVEGDVSDAKVILNRAFADSDDITNGDDDSTTVAAEVIDDDVFE